MTEWRPIEYQERTPDPEGSQPDGPLLVQEMLHTPVPLPPPSVAPTEPGIVAIVIQRTGAMLLSLAIAAVIIGGLLWPVGVRLLPTKVMVSQVTVLGWLFTGSDAAPATQLSTMVAAMLVSIAGAAVLAWVAAALASLTKSFARGIASFATTLTVIHYLLWFAFASTWQIVAPWLVAVAPTDGRPVSADGLPVAITGFDFGTLAWWAIAFGVVWLFLGLVRNAARGGRAGVAKSALVLIAMLTTVGAVTVVPVRVVGPGAGATGSSAASMVLSAMSEAEGNLLIVAWSAAIALGVFLLMAGLTAVRATNRGAAPMLGVLVTAIAVTVLASVSSFLLLVNYGAVDSQFGWVLGPYRPVNQVTVFAALAVTALFAVSTSQLKRTPKPVVIRRPGEDRVSLGEPLGEQA